MVLINIPILVFYTKQDLNEKAQDFDLLQLSAESRDVFFQNCDAITGTGLVDGLEWLVRSLQKK